MEAVEPVEVSEGGGGEDPVGGGDPVLRRPEPGVAEDALVGERYALGPGRGAGGVEQEEGVGGHRAVRQVMGWGSGQIGEGRRSTGGIGRAGGGACPAGSIGRVGDATRTAGSLGWTADAARTAGRRGRTGGAPRSLGRLPELDDVLRRARPAAQVEHGPGGPEVAHGVQADERAGTGVGQQRLHLGGAIRHVKRRHDATDRADGQIAHEILHPVG